jgi:hypothetical protein
MFTSTDLASSPIRILCYRGFFKILLASDAPEAFFLLTFLIGRGGSIGMCCFPLAVSARQEKHMAST